MHVAFDHLLEYTEWERGLWHETFTQHGAAALNIPTGAHGDGRFETIGQLVRHIFSGELRYCERLLGLPTTDTSVVAAGDVEALFAFGRQSRATLQRFVDTLAPDDWDVEREFVVLAYQMRMTPRKVITHVVTHQIRHWAQVATLLRMHGIAVGFHDFLACPVFGGSWKKVEPTL